MIYDHKPIKILHVYKAAFPFSFGGVERMIHHLAKTSLHYGVQADVLCLRKEKHDQINFDSEYTIISFKEDFELLSTGVSINYIKKFNEISKEYDIIHYHYPWPFMDFVHIFSRINKPSIMTYHLDIVRQRFVDYLYSPFRWIFFKKLSHIVTTSPNYASSSRLLIKYKDKLKIIPIGIDESSYPIPKKNDTSFWEKRVGSGFFLFIGVMRYYKGLHYLLEAMIVAPFNLVIVGSGPLEKKLISFAKKNNLTNVKFLGAQSDEVKMILLNLCCAVVLPSNFRSEAFGVSLLEGAMFSKALVSCEISTGTTFVNIHNETGLVVKPSNSNELRSALFEIHCNEEKTKKYGYNARKRFEEKFSAEVMTKAYVKLYRQMLFE